MNDIQRKYIFAREVYKQINTRCDADIAALPEYPTDDEAIDAVAAIYERHGWGKANKYLHDAEKELLKYCRNLVKDDPKTARRFAANQKQLDDLFNNYYRFPNVQEKLIDICLRVAA